MTIALAPTLAMNGLFVIGVTNAGAPQSVTSVPGDPTLLVNGSAASLGPATYLNNDQTMSMSSWRVLSPSITSEDILTFTIPADSIVTAAGSNAAISSPAPVINSLGVLEAGYGGLSFNPAKVMRLGVNFGGGNNFISYIPWSAAMNLRYRMQFVAGPGTTLVYNSSDLSMPQSWTSSGYITATIFNFSQTNGIEVSSGQVGYPVPQGQYIFSWEDANAGTSGQAVGVMGGNSNVITGVDTSFTSGVGQVTVSGSRVTVTYPAVAYKSTPNLTHGYNADLSFSFKNTSGMWGENSTITNFIAVGPGDSIEEVLANPLAAPNWLVNALTSENGNGPAYIRPIEQVTNGGCANIVNYEDCPNINGFSWCLQVDPISIPISFARSFNTNPALDNVVGNGTYPWAASTKIYDSVVGFDGTDSVGAYLDLSARPDLGGETDYGAFANVGGPPVSYTAIEFLTSSPLSDYRLRSGDIVIFPIQNGSATAVFPCTGGATTSLPNVSVENGSNSITFVTAPSPPLSNQQGIEFGSDTTGSAYWIQGTGTSGQTVYTIFSSYQGTTSAFSTCNMTAATNINNLTTPVHLTGSNSFMLVNGFTSGVTSGTGIQRLTSTVETPVSVTILPYNSGGQGPYGLYANIASNWPGCSCVFPLTPYMTVECLQSIADEIAVNSLANATIFFELGLEHWNLPGFKTGFLTTAIGKLLAYAAPGWEINSYYTVPGTPEALISDYAYTMVLGYMHDIIQAQFDTHNKGLTVGRVFGGFWSGSQVATNMVAFASEHSVPMGYVSVAPYFAAPSSANTTFQQACDPSDGNWPVGLIHDFYRYYCIYDTAIWTLFSENYSALQAYTGPVCAGQTNGKPTMFGYENQIQSMDPNGNVSLEHDLFYYYAMAQTWNAHLISIQTGSPLVAGSGLFGTCLYTALGQWGNASNVANLWSVFIYMLQPSGDGLANVFTTDQGAYPGSGNGLCNDMNFNGEGVQTGNVSVEGQELLVWFQAVNNPPTPPPVAWSTLFIPHVAAL